jgi:hypothetical protein
MRAFVLVLAIATPASAQIVRFDGIDPGAGPGQPRPNSDAAAAAFDAAAAALGPIQLIDAEALPLGNFTARAVAPGVTATLTDTGDEGGVVENGGPVNGVMWGTEVLGYNTTASGSRFIGVEPDFNEPAATLAFDFASAASRDHVRRQPVQAFGAYITGLGTASGQLSVLFSDGSNQGLPVVGDPTGGVLFFGFTSAGSAIASVALHLRGPFVSTIDIFGVDDIRYVFASPPASCTSRNGSDLNPADYSSSTSPALGSTWVTSIAVTATTFSTYQILGPGGPHDGIALLAGELLLAPVPAPIFLPGLGTHLMDLPANPAFAGLTIHTQGARIERDPVRLVLLNALDAHLR